MNAQYLVCEEKGHDPVDIDPTGGDPFMGGPVRITICRRCERELTRSETAKAYNAALDEPLRPGDNPLADRLIAENTRLREERNELLNADQCGQNQLVMTLLWLVIAAGCFIALAWVCTR